MVDPVNFTNFNRTEVELEEVALFSVLVAGKNALSTARSLETLLASAHWKLGIYGRFCPFHALRQFSMEELPQMLIDSGIGCYNSKSKSVYELVRSNLDLRTCSVADLEKIHGIGPKTARMFVLHTRPNSDVAALDVHILHYMSDNGVDVPRSTPTGKRYRELEKKFLEMAKKAKKSVADFDLEIWRKYSGREVA